MDAYCKCDKCGKEVKVDTSIVLTSNPPQYKYNCQNCGNVSYIQTAAVYGGATSRAISNAENSLNAWSNSTIYNKPEKEDCASCIHSSVCKYKEDFMKKLASIDFSAESFIRLRCECIHYQPQQYNYREITWLNNLNSINTSLNDNQDGCSNCDFMKKLLTDGNYIGDAPCEWCSKNPHKVTCGTGAAISSIPHKKTVINEVLDTVLDT